MPAVGAVNTSVDPVISRSKACSFNFLGRQSITFGHKSANAPVSIGHWSLITFECTESTSTPAGIPKEERSVYFQFHQWELGTNSQSPFSLPSSVGVLELFIHHSVIHFNHEVYYAIRRNQCWGHGSTHGYGMISSLNWEIATASPINHNEATSGSVKINRVASS